MFPLDRGGSPPLLQSNPISHPPHQPKISLKLFHSFTLSLLHSSPCPPCLCGQSSHRLAAFLFPRNAPKNSSAPSVLITSFFSSQPLRAIVTPYRINAKFAVLCESVDITTFTPFSLHILRYTY